MNIILFSQKDFYDEQISSALKNGSENRFVFFKNDERYIHIKKILKLSEGEIFKAGLINGKIGSAHIHNFSEEKIVFSFTETAEPLPLPPVKLILGFPRPIQLKRILRDAASLGVSELSLAVTELGEKSYLNSTLSAAGEIEKYLLDGISQAGQTLLPRVFFYNSLKAVLQNLRYPAAPLQTEKIILDIEETAEPLSKFKIDKNGTVIAAIGNERGWTETERRLFQDAGFKTYSMGKRILRTETAVCAALSVICSNSGFW